MLRFRRKLVIVEAVQWTAEAKRARQFACTPTVRLEPQADMAEQPNRVRKLRA